MRAPEKRTISLPAEQSGYIDRLVRSGAYASASDVVRAGLRALKERDALTERWAVATPVSATGAGLVWSARVSATDTVTVSVCAIGAPSGSSSRYYVSLLQ